ncbi:MULTISPECIES: fumarylacetoacetate hydrolase family protein [unclassified Amycolatopsis]|uniref:fumarylacetoacetate hydrolase family protein n=1 Tax=unclassified Amycolatopsis TaxID=2618356 RepID=UPI001C6A3C35|nr:fumarylacetoacetate hydrolase family protein [Amycolatopsis sp. DSM 110486]QYN20225.1 fumarylacetoacetate hydrolase family protein [Amycolatopsis sp. DSM 110486]
MKIGYLDGRAVLAVPGGVLDVHRASGGKLPSAGAELFGVWDELRALAQHHAADAVFTVDEARLGPPCPAPRQVFAIGLNYRDHASEASFAVPDSPTVFPKYVSSFTGAHGEVTLNSDTVDWEVELVAVIGMGGHRIPVADAWSHVAGLSVGQDLSDRTVQMSGPAPQFGLGKSFPGFSPIGPWLVTPDELADPDDLELGCSVNGEQVQKGRTRDLVFPIPELIARLSEVVTLYPGDVIFTGTPAGVGMARTPKWFLKPGDVLTSYVRGIGEMRHVLVGADA